MKRTLMPFVLVALAAVLSACTQTGAASTPGVVTMYSSPTCGCCGIWAQHLEDSGFTVKTVKRADIASVRQQKGVPGTLASCHTAEVGGYVVEGHIPADAVRRLLAERPNVRGIAVPGMPVGSPGMEQPSGREDPYTIFSFDENGRSAIWATGRGRDIR
jgi:hypothetical protein